MRVLVHGGNELGSFDRRCGHCNNKSEKCSLVKERKFVHQYLSGIHSKQPITELICGDDQGAGHISFRWAALNHIPRSVWKRKLLSKSTIANFIHILSGRKLGITETDFSRGMRMIAESNSELVISFGGKENAFAIIKEAKGRGIPVVDVDLPYVGECQHSA